MVGATGQRVTPTAEELAQMHAKYLDRGRLRHVQPNIVYAAPTCPHTGCGQRMQAIDFRLEAYGPAVHDPLVRAWWNDSGFAGRCCDRSRRCSAIYS